MLLPVGIINIGIFFFLRSVCDNHTESEYILLDS